MVFAFQHIRRWLAAGTFFILVLALCATFLFPRLTYAQGNEAIATTELGGAEAEATCYSLFSPACVGVSIKEVARIIGDRVAAPTFKLAIVQGLLNISNFVANRLAFESAMLIANGGPGQGSLFYKKSAAEGFAEFGLDLAGQAVQELTDSVNTGLGTKFDLCLPPDPAFTLGLQIGIKQKYQPEKPNCSILEITSNWSSFVSDAYSTVSDPDKVSHAILSKFAESLKPGRNELSAALQFNIKLEQEVEQKKQLEKEERQASDIKDKKNKVSKDKETPKSVISQDFLDKLKKLTTGEETKITAADALQAPGDAAAAIGLTAASTFTNTLLSQLFGKIYSGLFKSTPDNKNPFNVEAIADTGQKAEVLSKIFATTPVSTASYSALTEFVVCPPQGIANRGINNCVIDSNFLSILTRGNSGNPLTVQEAIDEKMINGNWPLISPEDKTSNQDPLCYTFGFCYSNLVKLRKARVVPIGWELAALRNSTSKPNSLQEIINDFNKCNQYGTIDEQHPFCHLVDPNWVLKYPETQCRATVNGEIRLTQLSPGRQSVCADATSCLGEDSNGECVSGYGYCVREKNVWRFRGDECAAQYAGCLAMKSTTTNKQEAFLINTVDFSVCGQGNAGCLWYRTNKELNVNKSNDSTDDTFDWLMPNEKYATADREDDWKFQQFNNILSPKYDFVGDSDATLPNSIVKQTPLRYSYEDRIYFTRAAQSCSKDDAGCSELVSAQDAVLNMVRNPSFEDDKNTDKIPDGWMLENLTVAQLKIEDSKPAIRGSKSVGFTSVNMIGLSQVLAVRPNQFYTFSLFSISDIAGSKKPKTQFFFYDSNGSEVAFSGSGLSTTCAKSGDDIFLPDSTTSNEWKRATCTFNTPSSATSLKILLYNPDNLRYDAVQLEPSETMNVFVEGFNGTNDQKQYTQIAPDYLHCVGSVTDPAACTAYAQMCQAQDVGCNRYTPDDGGPSIPAIASALDTCPAECVGYDTYKQEKTRYDDEEFPVYFIPTKATSCAAQYNGCDSFTNLSFAAEGGENVETYTNLRACATPVMADGTADDKQSSAFFTWEGSDQAGYQLRSWTLLESNATVGKDATAPCTQWKVTEKDTLVCDDTSGNHMADIAANTKCNAHDDIFNQTDNNCREFFDAFGNVHYRQFSDTVTINAECQPYRKDLSKKSDCDASGGFWDQQVGFCRYFGLKAESNSCPAAANGCRSYTGGAGRNSATLLSETFENGSYEGFLPWNDPLEAGTVKFTNHLKISNESIAADGHSLRVEQNTSSWRGVQIAQSFLKDFDNSKTYDTTSAAKKEATCTDFNAGSWRATRSITPAGCAIDIGKNGSIDCVVEPGKSSCGTLVNKIVKGKTFLIEFWAKGTGDLYAAASYKDVFSDPTGSYDLVSMSQTSTSYQNFTPLKLSGSWQLYSLGPFDSSKFQSFDQNSILFFYTKPNNSFFLDNLVIKQAQENITLVKDSWTIPSTCDQAPNGVNSPQYFLGCEAYADQRGKDHSLYQFSKLCSEKVVGCEQLYQTFESESVYSQVSNVRCAKGTNGKLEEPAVVNSGTACTVNGVEYCTIAAGRSYCTFDHDGTFPELLPRQGDNGIVYGPETVVTKADRPVYIVNDGRADCSAGNAGCTEVGRPKFAQDQKTVESFESAYFVNDPDQYKTILCDNEALFCEEYTSTKDGNYYFKSPVGKTCEYQSSVEVEGKTFQGWFRTGTSIPCYWKDKNADGVFKLKDDSADITNGNQMLIWKNGDGAKYDGWVGSCPVDKDLCTEFIDVVDTEGGLKKDGTSYYFVNNDRLIESTNSGSTACKGQVSQKLGCALFNNRSRSELKYNASATYVVSTHADEILSKAPNSLVDPVSCAGQNGVAIKLPDGTDYYPCINRCRYSTPIGDPLQSSMAQFIGDDVPNSKSTYFERSCFVPEDCPTLFSKNGVKAELLECADHGIDDYKLNNDSNTVQKVARDRSCSAWLACDSARTSWNEQTNKYEPICDSIDLCVKGGALGQTAVCDKFDPRDPEILTDYQYSARDVTWSGYELSGFAIPNQLPVELYDQYNLGPEKACQNDKEEFIYAGNSKLPVACDDDNDCTSKKCVPIDPDYRLVYNAGPCDSSKTASGGSCQVGHCQTSGAACSTNKDCGDQTKANPDKCMTGACQAVAKSGCKNADCSCTSTDTNNDLIADDCKDAKTSQNGNANICDPIGGVCVDQLTTAQNSQKCGPGNACGTGATCIASTFTAIGACFSNRCLTGISDTKNNGYADAIKLADALPQSCRGYPEVDSPYPAKIVEEWATPIAKMVNGKPVPEKGVDYSEQPTKTWSHPYGYKTGYQDSNVCAVDSNGNVTNCDCSYEKIEYGNGVVKRFEKSGAKTDIVGYCNGGPFEGHICTSDITCSIEGTGENGKGSEKGTCLKLSRQDTLIGWKGFCIEKDSSIQLYASTEKEDRACLTWLPVDQLSGATDLYAKYTSAGFAPEDVYYCADIGLAYDLSITGVECAETEDGACQNSTDETKHVAESDFLDDEAYLNVHCPAGYYAIMAGCGEAAPGGMCQEAGGDDDWPYFCVPKFSYHTLDDKGELITDGEPCKIPTENPITKDKVYVGNGNGTDIYLLLSVADDDWSGVRYGNDNSYDDCKVRGVFDSSPSISGNASLYTKLGSNGGALTAYPACGSLVQVAFEKDQAGQFNAAWTNRLWKQTGYHLTNSIQENGYSTAYACAETDGISYCSDPFDDNPWGSVGCGADQFAILGPCDDDDLNNKCSYWDEDDDYPFYCVTKGLKRVLENGTEEECLPPKAGDYHAGDVAGPTKINGSTDIYYMNAAKWKEYQVVYGKCGRGTFGYSVETQPVVFGKAIDIANKIDAGIISDPYPHRLAMCLSGSDQILPLEGAVCPAGTTPTTTVTQEEARPYYGVKVTSTIAFGSWCNSDEDCNGGSPTCEQKKCLGGTKYNNAACDATLGTHYLETNIKCNAITDQAKKQACITAIQNSINKCNAITDQAKKDACFAGFAEDVCENVGGSCGGSCVGGNVAGASCLDNNDCAMQYCHTDAFIGLSYCMNKSGSSYSLIPSAGEGVDIASKRIKQLFAKTLGLLRFQSDNIYPIDSNDSNKLATGTEADFTKLKNKIQNTYDTITSSVPAPWNWDIRKNGDDAKSPKPPMVLALGSCNGTSCREGREGAFTINDQDQGDIEGTGSERATVSFFTYADSEQMPIRKIIMDWGDGKPMSGSTAPDNYYKNHRGLGVQGQEICTNTADEFGKSLEACSSSYVVFNHDYVCSEAQLLQLDGQTCKYADDGRLLNSPCTDGKYCIYQPRVHVLDNWGWCTGFCTAGDDETNGCFSGTGNKDNECRYNDCPSKDAEPGLGTDSDCPDTYAHESDVVNPWVNFQGYIKIEPED